MLANRKAIIVGAGVGGLATSIFLAQNGFEVKIFEKNSFPGGRCGQIIRDGHRFDIGASILLMPELYKSVFKSLGLDFNDLVADDPIDTLYRLFFDDGSQLEITTDHERLKKQVEAIESGSYERLENYISEGYELYKLSFNELLGKNFLKASDFINLKNIILLLRLKALRKHNSYIRKFFKHPHLKMAFTFQNIYVGQSPYEAPALFSMLPAIELTEGTRFLKGGMYAIVDKLLSVARDKGVEIIFNNPVVRFETNKESVSKIIFGDGSAYSADLFVANPDLPYVYRDLLPDKKESRRMDRMKYSCSAIVYHWALDKTYPEFSLHNVFLSDKYRENLDHIFKYKSLSSHPDFYIYAPVRFDPAAAPNGQDSLSVIIPAGHLDDHFTRDWTQLSDGARNYVFRRLASSGLTDIKEHIKFEIQLQPGFWQKECNVSRGGVFGSINHSIMQMGYFRPHNRHDRFKNLYFVGGSTHPGGGVPMVLLSAKLVSERILNDES